MISFWIGSDGIRKNVFIPKYYDPRIERRTKELGATHVIRDIGSMEEAGLLSASTGHEIGKEAYGTGSIPFVRTSDISNWEVKTVPKQGVSQEIYEAYADKQDVREGDVLFVRDGTYLIGTNCFVTGIEKEMLFQSHILKFRINDESALRPEILFLALNSPFVQAQVRSVQFTADIIDTIGRRYKEIRLPIIKDERIAKSLAAQVKEALETRVRGKAFVKQAPVLIENCLSTGSIKPIADFENLSDEEIREALVSDTVTMEFGEFEATFVSSTEVRNRIFLPKYYDPEIDKELKALSTNCDILTIQELVDQEFLEIETGHEVGKLAYGTGDIPFLRTSDFANWEVKHDPKHCVGEKIYEEYSGKQSLKPLDILLVRDGTYLVGSSTIMQPGDEKALFCGGLYRIRSLAPDRVDPYLLLGVLNSYIVKRQFRSRQFTRDVIDTLGRRLFEVRVPWPKDEAFRGDLSARIRSVVEQRNKARDLIKQLAADYAPR